MNPKKSQNSLLILTTLGVYLGLLMVGGAAPQVFAHSATTRNFEISDEIEVKDDLDKKPDDERSTARESLETYLQDVEIFLKTLKRLGRSGYFDPLNDTFEVGQATQLPCVPANETGSYTANKFVARNDLIRPHLERFSKLLTDGYSLGDCLPGTRFAPGEATESRFEFRLSQTEFSVDVTARKLSPNGAKMLARVLDGTARLMKAESKDAIRLKLFARTSFHSDKDHVRIVTRLPRADLDALLAKDAK